MRTIKSTQVISLDGKINVLLKNSKSIAMQLNKLARA